MNKLIYDKAGNILTKLVVDSDKLKELMHELNLKPKELSEKAHVSLPTIKGMMNGSLSEVNMRTLNKVALGLRVSANELTTDEPVMLLQ